MKIKALISRFNLWFFGPEPEIRHVMEYYDWLQSKPKQSAFYNKQNKLHRLDGPAVQMWSTGGILLEENWYRDGKLHRLDGPAIRHKSFYSEVMNEEYYINNVRFTKEEFDEYVKGLDSKEDKELLGDLGQTF